MNAFNETQHPRVASGQFTDKRNTAPANQLVADEVLTGPDTPTNAGVLTEDAIRASQATLKATALSITRSFNIDESNADDIVQDSWLHLLERDTRKGDIVARASEKPFLNLTARKYGNNYGNDARFGLRSEEFSARRRFREAEITFERDNGRKMRPSEREKLADEVRLSYPAGRRPKADYWRQISQLSLDVNVGDDDGGTRFGDLLEAGSDIGFDDQEDAAAAELHAYEGGEKSKDDVRKDMWRVMTIRFDDAPQAIRGSLDPAEVKSHKSLVKNAGGARMLALAWLDGETTEAQEAALFAPFGDIDNKQRQRVVDVLDENPKFADHLWASVLTAAQR